MVRLWDVLVRLGGNLGFWLPSISATPRVPCQPPPLPIDVCPAGCPAQRPLSGGCGRYCTEKHRLKGHAPPVPVPGPTPNAPSPPVLSFRQDKTSKNVLLREKQRSRAAAGQSPSHSRPVAAARRGTPVAEPRTQTIMIGVPS